MVVEDFRAWAARAGVAHCPEIVRRRDPQDLRFRQPRDFPPQVEGLVVLGEHRHQEPLRVPVLHQQVVDPPLDVPAPAHLEPGVLRCEAARGSGARRGRRADRELDRSVECLGAELGARGNVQHVRRPIERRCPPIERVERHALGAEDASSADEHDADLAASQFPGPLLAPAQPHGREADVGPARAIRSDELDVALGVGLRASANEQLHQAPAASIKGGGAGPSSRLPTPAGPCGRLPVRRPPPARPPTTRSSAQLPEDRSR